jgi:hypothetical protein
MTTDRLTDDAELTLTTSPTAHLLDELSLYGYRPNGDEPNPRPLPEPGKLQGALADVFDALVAWGGVAVVSRITGLARSVPDLIRDQSRRGRSRRRAAGERPGSARRRRAQGDCR